MKSIRILERRNLGDYSHREIEITESIEDTASIDDAVHTLNRKIHWHLAKPEREAEYAKQQKLLASDDEKVKSYAERFVERYEAQLKEIEGV